jgi:hypothetical protein
MTRPGSGVGNRHEPPLCGVEHFVERNVPAVHARRADRVDLFLRQPGGGEAAAVFAEALELLIFVSGDEVAGDLAVARYGTGSRWARIR